jgi:hypothetical protein
VTWTNNPNVPTNGNWSNDAECITAALEATANYGDAYGWKNVTLQRIDPRIRGYGNSTIGYSNFVAAPYTLTRNFLYPGLIYMGGGNNDSNNPSLGCNTYYGGIPIRKSDGTYSFSAPNQGNAPYGIQGIRIWELQNRDIPADPSPLGTNEPEYFTANQQGWIYFFPKLDAFDFNGNAVVVSPNDLGKVMTNLNWRTLRFMPRHQREAAKNLIPDWAMLDVISFSSNNSSSSNLKIAPINPNGAFAVDTTINNSTITPRNNIPSLLKALESTSATDFQLGSALARTVSGSNMTFDKVDMRFEGTDFITFRGNTPFATSISGNITSNSTTKWSTINSTWSAWRTARNWPSTSLILPGEVTEIQGVADYGRRSQYQYDNSGTSRHKSIKENEGRLSAFFPGLTTCSNFFTVYAFAQALDKLGNIDSEALTKTLVEVEITAPATATTAAQYKVKKLYTQPIPLGQ